MSDATRYRRSIIVSRAVVAGNVAILREHYGLERFAVWARRRSGFRFLDGFRSMASDVAVTIFDGEDEPEFELRLNQILGGHPELRCALSLETHLLSVRQVASGAGVSYGATFVAPEDMRVGLAPIGFGDGIDRRLSGSLRVRVDGTDVAVLGRIAMDSISLDLREIPEALPGAVVSVYGDAPSGEWSMRDASDVLGILPTEIITRLSERAEVIWR